MPAPDSATVVVGIDVGGPEKGFHAVALAGGSYSDRLHTADVTTLVSWCVHTVKARVIAVDAPCRWRTNEEGRPAERELMQQSIWCFSTPTTAVAHQPHPTGYYDWMLSGEALYQALNPTHPLCDELPPQNLRCCFETFPHAIAWHMRGGNANAKQKRAQRRQLLQQHQIALAQLTNIDWVDAALCALTAHMAASGQPLIAFGEPQTGFIIVPAMA